MNLESEGTLRAATPRAADRATPRATPRSADRATPWAADRPAWGWPPEGVEREGKPAATPMKMWPVCPR